MRKLLAGICLMFFSVVSQAEVLGLLNGRTADLTRLPDVSIEGGAIFGDYSNIGARVNYRLSPGLILFGDFGMAEFDAGFGSGSDGTAFGFGVFYALEGLFENMDSAVKGSYHTSEQEISIFEFDVDVLAIEFLVSGLTPLSSNGMMWYANAGINRLDSDSSAIDSTELLLGGGVVLPLGPGEAYAGIDLVDEIGFGAGFRYFLQ